MSINWVQQGLHDETVYLKTKNNRSLGKKEKAKTILGQAFYTDEQKVYRK